jgi:UDP-glucose 4-epimerase
MRVLVLGGDGFLGSHLVDQAVSLGHEVTVFDRFPYGVSRNLEHQRRKVRFVSGEFANRTDLFKALEGQDVVYHFICATNPAESWDDPLVEIDENLRTSIQFFEMVARGSVRKIIFPSSGGTVYGPQETPVDEKTIPKPVTPYGIVKLSIENFLHYFVAKGNIQADIYRIGNAYGPRQPVERGQGVIAVWMREILKGNKIQVYGDRTTLRDYVYVKDIAFLMASSLNNLESSEVYNLGSGVGVSILGLLEIFKRVIDEPIQYAIHPRRSFDNASIILDSSKLLTQFPEFHFQELEDKIAETWQYVKRKM